MQTRIVQGTTMKKSILSLGIMTCLCAGLSHAGFLDNALKAVSAVQNKDTASALNHVTNMATSQQAQKQTTNQYQKLHIPHH